MDGPLVSRNQVSEATDSSAPDGSWVILYAKCIPVAPRTLFQGGANATFRAIL